MGMMRNDPYIAHSELTNEIYIIDRQTKYSVTDQVVKAVVATDRAIPKAQYEARLKADMVAMLTEIQLEMEEKSIVDYDEALYDGGECVISISEINDIIQQKIDKLKGGAE